MIALKNILVATDFGDASDAALLYGRTLARRFGASLHVMHVFDNVFLRATVADPHAMETHAQRRLQKRLTDQDREDLRAKAVLVESDAPANEITAYAEASGIDLIVMGTHGRSGMSHVLIGSVAERVVRTAPCPVLTIKCPEHEFVTSEPGKEGRAAFWDNQAPSAGGLMSHAKDDPSRSPGETEVAGAAVPDD
jgi:nucleotide-binding universal stress UspA family protein